MGSLESKLRRKKSRQAKGVEFMVNDVAGEKAFQHSTLDGSDTN